MSPKRSDNILRSVLGLFWMALACAPQSRAAAGDNVLEGLNPLTVPVGVLHDRIELETAKVSRRLSPEGRRVMNGSLRRFFEWAAGYCQGDARCLRNQYYNYLAAIPDSVYRVGHWTVYSTGIYALEWADEDLQGMDPERALTWDLQLAWPRVDAESPVPKYGLAYGGLATRVRKLMADWIEGGWTRIVDVHLEAFDECYVSASITGSTYSGGAHPYEDFSTFNWNVKAKRTLENRDLFRTDVDWKSEILALYRRRLQASGADLSERELSPDGINSLFTDGFAITPGGLRFVRHQGDTRNDDIAAVDLSWNDLAPWLIPGAICPIPPNDRPL